MQATMTMAGQVQTGPQFPFIDAVRGYAVMLVVMSHAAYLIPELPFPVHRLATLGWFGVQLFFLASAVTLMMSWQHELSRFGRVSVPRFFLRRLFRIAPAYYAAAGFYLLVAPPSAGFAAGTFVGSLLFVNAWHPVLMGVTPNGWSVVPGGWSIGVEFTFYAAFPLLATLATSLARASGVFVVALAAGAALNEIGWRYVEISYGHTAADLFIYYWFPNQFCVFALGLMVFHLLHSGAANRLFGRVPAALLPWGAVGAFGAIPFVPTSARLAWRIIAPPEFVLSSLVFVVLILALSRIRAGFWVNPAAAFIGRVSFSAYLLHFGVLELIRQLPPLRGVFGMTGWPAIAGFAVLYPCVMAITAAGSWVSYQVIEAPMIAVGKRLFRRQLAGALAPTA